MQLNIEIRCINLKREIIKNYVMIEKNIRNKKFEISIAEIVEQAETIKKEASEILEFFKTHEYKSKITSIPDLQECIKNCNELIQELKGKVKND